MVIDPVNQYQKL